MKYIKLYENFIKDRVELSDTKIDDVLKPEFFEDEEDEYNGVIIIKNWNVY